MDTWLTGPVAITGATGHVGRHLLVRLAALPNEVRPLDPDSDLHAAFDGAQSVILVSGSLHPEGKTTYESANVDPVRAAVAALEGTGVERVVLLSAAGADPAADNEYLRAKGRAEWSVLRSCCTSVVILRTTHIVGEPGDPGPLAELLQLHGERLDVPGEGTQIVQPVYVGDVAEALVRAALVPEVRRGTMELAGPEDMTLDELVSLVNGHDVPEHHLRPFVARQKARHRHYLTPAIVELLLEPNIAHPPLATALLGIEPAPLGSIWAREVAAA